MKAVEKYIYQRGDGQFLIRFRKKGYPNFSATRPTLQLARELLAVTQSAMYRNEYVKTEKLEVVTLERALTKYADTLAADRKGEKQILVRIAAFKLHKMAKIAVPAITQEDIKAYIEERRAMPSQNNSKKMVADSTIRKEVMLLSAVFKACIINWKWLRTANPCSHVCRLTSLGESEERIRRYVGDEESRLLAKLDEQCRNKDIPAVVRFATWTAARQSEIIGKDATSKRPATPGLCWEHVNLPFRQIVFKDTKNGKDRVVPLNDAAHAMLSARPRPIHGGPVFKVTQDGLIRAMQSATEAAKIEDFHFHDLRHEATSRMIESGMTTEVVQKITGHSNAEMTKRYTHIDVYKQALVMPSGMNALPAGMVAA